MSNVNSTLPTSRRGYLSQSELEQFANITVTDTTEADDRISQAEEIIDTFVGFQEKFIDEPIQGRLSATNGTTSHTLETSKQNSVAAGYYVGLQMEIIGGAGIGQRRTITASTAAGVLTTEAFSTSLSSTSIYRITQLGKFPRKSDVFHDGESTPNQYYKSIPEAVKRAVAAQVEFLVQMGDAYFQSNKADMISETIGDYSYTKGQGGSGLNKLTSPKARTLLRGIVNRKGQLVA